MSESSLHFSTSRRSSTKNSRHIILGICAMDNKARSKPMRKILDYLLELNAVNGIPKVTSSFEISTVIFGDQMLLQEPVEKWPCADALIVFYSKGFPYAKALEYVKLRKPYMVNDLLMQQVLLDRRISLAILDAIDIRTPYRIIVNRPSSIASTVEEYGIELLTSNGAPVLEKELIDLVSRNFNVDVTPNSALFSPMGEVVLLDADTLKVGKNIIKKPFVEKPVLAEDHNIWIYYPGGGVRKLFRKIANKSSEYVEGITDIRRDGSYIYESFIDVDNSTDVKVYTIGPYQAYAETRKSPVVDGIVRRNPQGKEVRAATSLNSEENETARRIAMAFSQGICGFDIARSKKKIKVIDVNGWSFVKSNETYYEKSAKFIRDTLIRHCGSKKKRKGSYSNSSQELDISNRWRLKAFIGVFRHADRTPKRKLKFFIDISAELNDIKSNPLSFFSFLNESNNQNQPYKEVTIKGKDLLLNFYKITEAKLRSPSVDEVNLLKLKEILGLKLNNPDTKIQLKYSAKYKSQILIIVKWGGEFTHAGRHHAAELGENLRKELSLLNKKVVQEDVRILCSSERRVIATADAFAKAYLPAAELPEDLIKINKEMLDDNFLAKDEIDSVKDQVQKLFQEIVQSDNSGETLPENLTNFFYNLVDILLELRTIMTNNFSKFSGNLDSFQKKWCCLESPFLFQERWEKLFHDFCDFPRSKIPDKFDISKISELYDSLKYDALHNRTFMERIFTVYDPEIDVDVIISKFMTSSTELQTPQLIRLLYKKSKVLFDFITPREYGFSSEEKTLIGKKISGPLIESLIQDFKDQIASAPGECSSRFYFTKESHMHTLLNFILHTDQVLRNNNAADHFNELDYMSHITFEISEKSRTINEGENEKEMREFSVRLALSSGAHTESMIDLQIDRKHSISVVPRKWISEWLNLETLIETFEKYLVDFS